MERPAPPSPDTLVDGFGRRITYLRLSVTDRCDLRCRYCMAESMTFLPRAEVLTLEELAAIADVFVERGVRKIRLTGGEPLVRRGIDGLARTIGRHLATSALDELTLTTNGMRLGEHAGALRDAGIRRINVSLDTRDRDRFRHVTRWGDLDKVLGGIAAARDAGLAIKINMVALKGINEDEIAPMLGWCVEEGHDLTLIETMPLGPVDEDRTDHYLPLDGVRAALETRFALLPVAHRTGGPARYLQVAGSATRLGFITPLTRNFCEGCNRVRLTTSGRLYMCLGHDDSADLKAAYRDGGRDAVARAIDAALVVKPRAHAFRIVERGAAPAVSRHMSATGG
jgi:cyclic pyranopterin phosphate synthase